MTTTNETEQPAEPVGRAVRIGQLLDLYGSLLTDRQREFVSLHYNEDLSFGEIAEDFGVSRQAVHDAVKHAEAALEDYEAKLGFLNRPAGRVGTKSADGALDRLEDLQRDLLNSGGVIYNAHEVTGRLGRIIEDLRRELAG